jgi:hypothetical protein
MHWNDWPFLCWALSSLISLLGRRWIDAIWSACFAVFLVFDRLSPAFIPSQLKYIFLVVGVMLVAYQVGKNYSHYRKRFVVR